MEFLEKEFSQDQLNELQGHFPAVRSYLQLLKTNSPNLDPVKKQRHEEWLRVVGHSYYNSKAQKPLLKRWSDFIKESLCHELSKQLPELEVFALGKLGAEELNLSSDVDLILIGDPQTTSPTQLRKWINYFEERDQFGFIMRVDLDIRPGGKSSPLVQSFDQIENYYHNHGETWERLALIRLQKIYGKDQKVDQKIEQLKKYFCFRKHIDYHVFDEFSRLRGRIHFEISKKLKNGDYNVKLSPGGIRDIELFSHCLCLIHGGRNPQIISNATDDLLKNMTVANLISIEDQEFLIEHYWRLRRLENLIQAKNDSQIHHCNLKDSLIPLCFGSFENFHKDIERCNQIVSEFIEPKESFNIVFSDKVEEQKQFLQTHGFIGEKNWENWRKLMSYTVLSSRSSEREDLRKQVIGSFIKEIGMHSFDKEMSLQHLTDFFKSIRAKNSFFRFFQVHPETIQEISYLFSYSPFLSHKITQRPELIDSIIYRAQASPPEDLESYLEFLADHKQLSQILYSTDFLKDKDLNKLFQKLSFSADFITSGLLKAVKLDQDLRILRLGKWGGTELGLHSDLDFIFIADKEDENGVLHKKARKFLNLIQSTYRAGNLYEIDMRLRPSGKAGPMLVTEENLLDYLQNRAEAWERQAYLKASFANHSTDHIREILIRRSINSQEETELSEIRKKLLKTQRSRQLDIKYNPGGLVDCELQVQEYILKHKIFDTGQSSEDFFETAKMHNNKWVELSQNYFLLRSLEQFLQLMKNRSSSVISSKDDFDLVGKIAKHLNSEFCIDNITKVLNDNCKLLAEIAR
ncbi:MAG: hypothetical protein VX642_12600 [Bdellovibrionota bacterium]|nr:hypothetical protein [Bdellovibrionota bacterium]